MSRQPRAHLYLKDAFLYYNRHRLYLQGGRSVKLDRADWSILECLVRGESELGVLAHSLSELEIGGDPHALAKRLLKDYVGEQSLLAAGEPLDVVEPDVIVCTFAPNVAHVDVAGLLKRLRRRFEVLHIGLEQHVSGDRRSNRTFQNSAEHCPSSFRFAQWARSFVRFSTGSVLVLVGDQDKILFGDMAARHHSLAFAEPEWPGPTGLQDILGSKALLRDPLASLQALFFAVRMTGIGEYDRLTASNSSELAALALYGYLSASDIAYTAADQPDELERLGREPETCAPAALLPVRFPAVRKGTGILAVVLDVEYFDQASRVIGVLHLAIQSTTLKRIVLRTQHCWFDSLADDVGVSVKQIPEDADPIHPEACVALPGLCRQLVPLLDTLREGTPTVLYPTRQNHPLLAGASPEWFAHATNTREWTLLLEELRQGGSPRQKIARSEARRVLRQWDVAERVGVLVER